MVAKKIIVCTTMLVAAAGLAACSGNSGDSAGNGGSAGGTTAKTEKPPEPVALTFYDPAAKQDPAVFMQQFGNAIVKKYPYITINYVSSPDTNPEGDIANRIAAGEPIDVMLNADINHYRLITPFKFEYDMNGLIKSRGYDLSKLDPSTVKAVQSFSSNGGMFALPYKKTTMGLMYNKDLFDKFGQAYPKDGMTWDQVYDVAKTMTRNDGGTQYRGFITQFYNVAWLNQLSLGFVDPKTDKPLFNTDDRWARLTKNLTRFYEIPGNATQETTFGAISNLFLKDQRAAMYAYAIPTTPQDVNWNVVTFPEFADRPGVGPQSLLTLAYVTSTSKHKEAAFDAISWLTSDEVQTSMSKQALAFPVVNSQAVKDAFGQDTPFLQDKNVKALMKAKPADPFPGSPYQRTAGVQFEKLMYQLTKGAMDVNTGLRTMAEEAEKEIEKAKSAAAAAAK